MTTLTPDPYLRTKVMTADPVELRLMLLDGAIKFAEQGRAGLADDDYEAVFNGISRCQSILVELMSSLRAEQDPELCGRLSSLYTFMYTRLMHASSRKSIELVDEVLDLLRFERQTWAMLIDKLASENAAATDMTATPAAPVEGRPDAAPGDRASSLIGGTVSVRG